MIIYEVQFQAEPNVEIKSAYFSSKSKADNFVIANLGEMLLSNTARHQITKTKAEILKFLNRDNGLG